MVIDSLMVNEGPAIYYDKAFRSVLEDHMTFLREHQSTMVKVIDAGKAFEYANDWYGLFTFYGIPPQLHWVTLRLNNKTSPSEAFGNLEVIAIPDQRIVDFIRQSYTSTNRIS